MAIEAPGEDLRLNNGGVLVDARLERRSGDVVSIAHRTGAGTYRIDDFDARSQAWLRERYGNRNVGGLHPVNDRKYKLAWELMGVFWTNRTVKVDLGLRIHRAVNPKDKTQATQTEPVDGFHRIRKTLAARFYASELTEEELEELLAIYKSPLQIKYRRLSPLFSPELGALGEAYFASHPELAGEWAARLAGKSRTTGTYYSEMERIVSEVYDVLEDRVTAVLARHFTADEVAELRETWDLKTMRRLNRLSEQSELMMPGILRRYIEEKPEDLSVLIEWFKEGLVAPDSTGGQD